jgi:DNA polymerase-4
VGQVAELTEGRLVAMLGQAGGRHLHALAHNVDPRRVRVGQRRRSIGAQRALGRKPRPPAELAVLLAGLVDRVARRLRAAERVCRTVTIRMRFADFNRATRSRTLSQATAQTDTILVAAQTMLTAAIPLIADNGITLIGVALSNLDNADAVQLALPFDEPSTVALDSALDSVRDRFGSAAVTRAALLRHGSGLTVPMLPD